MPNEEKQTVILARIDELKLSDRAILSCDPQETTHILIGVRKYAPDMACAECGAILVSGMLIDQFSFGEREPSTKFVSYPSGVTHFQSIPLDMQTVILHSKVGPIVLRCPRCLTHNEVVAIPSR